MVHVESAAKFRQEFLRIERAIRRKSQEEDQTGCVYTEDEEIIDYGREFRKFVKQSKAKPYGKLSPEKEKKEDTPEIELKEYRPVIIEKAQIDRLKKEQNSLMLIGLYAAYYSEGNRQLTNQPHATDEFMADKFGCSRNTIAKYKKVLIEIKFIEQVEKKNKGRTFRYVRLLKYRKLGDLVEVTKDRDKWKRRALSKKRKRKSLKTV